MYRNEWAGCQGVWNVKAGLDLESMQTLKQGTEKRLINLGWYTIVALKLGCP